LQQRLRDLGLPCGPNPGKELLDALAEAIAAADDALVKHLRDKAIARQKEISVAGGEWSSFGRVVGLGPTRVIFARKSKPIPASPGAMSSKPCRRLTCSWHFRRNAHLVSCRSVPLHPSHTRPPPPHPIPAPTTHPLTHPGRALQQWLRDLGLPYGPNPGKELLDALAEAIAADDDALVKHLRDKAIARQKEILVARGVAGGE